jgi:hypothetical protein
MAEIGGALGGLELLQSLMHAGSEGAESKRGPSFRRKAFSLPIGCSIGLKSGLWGGDCARSRRVPQAPYALCASSAVVHCQSHGVAPLQCGRQHPFDAGPLDSTGQAGWQQAHGQPTRSGQGAYNAG